MYLACGTTTCFEEPRGKSAACCLLLVAVVLGRLSAFSQSAPSNRLEQQQVIQFLDKSVDWYQNRAGEQQVTTTPGDILFVNNGRPLADQILRLSFDFARASISIVGTGAGPAANLPPSTDTRRQALAQATSKVDEQLAKTRSELEGLRKKLETASAQAER